MRFRLTLHNNTPQTIPINYQYPLSAWIYKVIHESDADFARWLHEQGYMLGEHRRFKLFTFSRLHMPDFRMNKEDATFTVKSRKNNLTLSFFLDEAAEHFVTGLFQDQEVAIRDRHTEGRFTVKNVEKQPEPEWTETMRFRTLSPLCVVKPRRKNGKLYGDYLSPEHEEFGDYFWNNLIRRYVTATRQLKEKERYEMNGTIPDYQLLSKPKSKLLTVKAHSPEETKVKGYLNEFQLTAPPELLRFGYYAGFGEKNSLGMGCVETKS